MPSHRDRRFTRIVQSNSFSDSNTGCDVTDCSIELEVSDPKLQLLPDVYDRTKRLLPWKTVFRSNASPHVTLPAMRNHADSYSLNLENVEHLDVTAADDNTTPHHAQRLAKGETHHEYNFELEMKNLRIYEGLKDEDTSPFPVTSLNDPSELFTCLVPDRKIYIELKVEDIIERAMEVLTLTDSEEKGMLSMDDRKGTSTRNDAFADNDQQTTRRLPLTKQNLNAGVDVGRKDKSTLLRKENDERAMIDVKELKPSLDEINKTNIAEK